MNFCLQLLSGQPPDGQEDPQSRPAEGANLNDEIVSSTNICAAETKIHFCKDGVFIMHTSGIESKDQIVGTANMC